MFMKFAVFVVAAVLLLAAMPDYDEWQHTYGDASTQLAGAIFADDDFILMAVNTFVTMDNIDAMIIKLDKNGNVLWSKTFGGNGEDVIQKILKCNDYYFAIGYTESYGNGEADYWVLKFDGDGNEIWEKTYGSSNVEFASDAVCEGNSIIIVGLQAAAMGSTEQDAWVIKIDCDGNLIWEKTFGGSDIDWLFCIEKDGDDFIMGGYTASFTSVAWDAWLVKIDGDGNEIWNKTYGGGDVDTIEDIVVSGEGYIAAGDTMSYGRWQDAFLMKVDKEGEQKWVKIFGGSDWDAFVAVEKEEDGYIIAGRTDSFGAGNFDAWLVKVDGGGNEIWNKTYGGRRRDVAWDVIAGSDYYYLFGETSSYGHGQSDAWLVKCGNYAPPTLQIVKPKQGYLYIFDREIFYVGTTIVIGKISVEVEVDGNVEEVLFYVNSKDHYATEPSFVDSEPPYKFEFGGKTSLYGYEIDALAYYSNSSANVADSIIFRKI